MLVGLAAPLCLSCASQSSVGYGDGVVTTSPVAYSFAAPPVLTQMKGTTYRVDVDGKAAAGRIASFDRSGMRVTSQRPTVQVSVRIGKVSQGKPGAMKLGKGYVPAFTVKVPYEVTISRGARQLSAQRGNYENMLTFKGGKAFPKREQAIAAIDAIRKLAKKGIETRARKGATNEAIKSANGQAKSLMQARNISLEVPVVRSAAGLDLEQQYKMLSEARNPEQVQEALAAYERVGLAHRKEDGAANNTANYGVACGIAAAKLFLQDLSGAWAASKQASQFEPRGEEVQAIQRVIYRQEKTTGIAVIPEADRKRIAKQEKMAEALQRVFARPGR